MPPERLRKAGNALSRIFWDALFALLLIILACLLAAAFIPAIATPTQPPSDVAAGLEKFIRQDGIRGVTFIVFRHGQQLYRVDAGNIDPDAVDLKAKSSRNKPSAPELQFNRSERNASCSMRSVRSQNHLRRFL